jgi:probable HAF family extracellular repeat protein
MNKFLKDVGIFSFLLLMAVRAQAAAQYTVIELGDFTPTAINNRGEVVGVLATASLQPHAVLCSNGVIKDLGTLGGTESFAEDINDNGEVVGYSTMLDGSSHAFLYDGTMRDLGTFGGINSAANGINNSGQIAANYQTVDEANHALIYDHGTISELGNFNGKINIVARGINSLCNIIINSQNADGTWHASVYKNGENIDLGITGQDSFAVDINDLGQIIGTSTDYTGFPPHAFLYTGDNITDINTSDIGALVTDINNNVEIVGYGITTYGPFIYKNGHITNLNELIDPGLEITLYGAFGINDNGQIVATGEEGAYLLTPVPEPSVFVLLYNSILVVCIYLWHKNR